MFFGQSVSACQTCLENIERYDGELRSFITVSARQALKQARFADEQAKQGKWLGPLHGMPVALKDNIDTEGCLTTRGAIPFAANVPELDAVVVSRLKRAGAIVLGKTTLGELVFDIRSHNPIVGAPRNPWDPERSPGGSSGGSASALAARMTVGALGSDTGGSIRIPAAHCGVAGLRPTHGVVPATGASAVSPQNDTLGPMARHVVDVARLFAVIAGVDAQDPYSVPHAYPDMPAQLVHGVQGLRIGIPERFYFDSVSSDIADAVSEAGRELERAGAVLVPIQLPGAEATYDAGSVLIYSDVAFCNRDLLQEPGQMTPLMFERMRRGLDLTAVDYAGALQFKREWQQTLRRTFSQVDLILTPTSPVPAIPNGETADLHTMTSRAAQFTYGGSLGGIPGLSLPCGFTRQGLPVGALLQGAWFSEPLLFRAGHAYQQTTAWHEQLPPVFGR